MISEWFLTLIGGFIEWFFGLIPDGDGIEAWSVTASNSLGPLLSGMGALGVWLPWSALAICVPVVVGMYVALFFIKMARNLFSHVPVIGGNG